MNRSMRITDWRIALALGCLLLAVPSLLAAQEPTSVVVPTTIEGGGTTSDLTADLQVEENALPLSLEQAIALALERNLSLVVQRYDRSRSIEDIQRNRGIYDVNLQTDLSYDTSSSRPRSTLVQADVVTEDNINANVQLRQLSPIGGTGVLSFNNNRVESSDANVDPSPQFFTAIDLRYIQPLLRNFGRRVTERNLIVARTNAAISREAFQTQVETVIQQVSDGYWNLVESLEQLQVAEESLSLAEDLHRMNQIQVEVGTMAPLEVVTSEARVAARRQDIIRFRAQVADNADVLRRLVNLDRGELWDVTINPVTSPEVSHQPIDLEAAVRTALENRPDLQTRRLQNETLELDAQVARNLKRPRLDATGSYTVTGFAGKFNQPDPAVGIGPGYSDALQEALRRDFDGWAVSLTFAYPLQNRDARARSAIADLARDQGTSQLDDLETQVLTEVRSAARAVQTAIDQIESSKVSRHLAERNLDAEQKRYENGLATTFQVLEIQEDLSEARRIEVSAVIQYRRAETAYFRAIGKLLDHVGVTLSDDLE